MTLSVSAEKSRKRFDMDFKENILPIFPEEQGIPE
jgi:hypothetical protein